MDLALTPDQTEFRDELRTWLADNVPSEAFARPNTVEGLAQHRAWEQELHAAGFAAVHWPTAFGGRSMDPIGTAIFYDEYLRAKAPERLNRLALGLAGPTLIEEGTPGQQARWVQKMLTCEELWCQGFSEPQAGSDLAAVQTRGEIDGDVMRVSGQKTWTSHSRFADWIFALVRTNPKAPKHRGLTFVMIDRHAPGVEMRPIQQMNHAADFAETFFTDVEVPLENVVGQIDDGWRVAMVTLGHERGSNLNTASHFHAVLDSVLKLVPPELLDDRLVRQEVGRFVEEIDAYRYMTLRTLTELSRHQKLGPQASMGKLWWSEMQTRIHEFGLRLLGPRAELLETEDGIISPLTEKYWLSRASHIYAGSSEIQRNIISERVLGLPRGVQR